MPKLAGGENMVLQNQSAKTGLSMPPVIVLNLFYSGLGIARQLWGTGVRVVGLSAHRRHYGNFTRLCEVRSAPNSQAQPQQLAEFLLNAATELQGAVIFPTRDADVIFLDRFRSELEPFYKLAIPPRQVLPRVLDKSALAETALKAGIPIPRTAVARSAAELSQAAGNVGFPCVMKPVTSVQWREGNNWQLVGARKAFRVDSLAGLQQAYQQVSQVCPEILLQEWIPGRTDELLVWGGYVSRSGEALASFTARKIVQCPEEFGTGCVVENAFLPDLLEASMRLCDALRYEGLAEIEYKRDARDGKLKLIEINPRHWDWHQLSEGSGVNLTRTAYHYLSGDSAQPASRPSDAAAHPARWIAEDSLLVHILRGLPGLNRRALSAGLWFSGKRIYGIFSWRDPLPFIRYSATALLPNLARGVVRKAGRKMFGRQVNEEVAVFNKETAAG